MRGEWKRRKVLHMSTNMRERGTQQSSVAALAPRAKVAVGNCRGGVRGAAATVAGNKK
jgi:hypothetical protein